MAQDMVFLYDSAEADGSRSKSQGLKKNPRRYHEFFYNSVVMLFSYSFPAYAGVPVSKKWILQQQEWRSSREDVSGREALSPNPALSSIVRVVQPSAAQQ